MRWNLATCMPAMILAGLAPAAMASGFPKPLAVEEVGRSELLPEKFPKSWVFVHDMYTVSILDGRVVIIDTAADTKNLKGQIPAAQFGNIMPSTTRNEIYVTESFYARVSRGERTDALTIWDTRTLTPKAEILLPGRKRSQSATVKNSLQLTNDERWALVFNFTPAASVTIVDLDGRKVLGDVEIPGCSQIYPTGQRGFSSLCADGTIMSVVLDEKGNATRAVTSKPFNDIDDDPMFMMPTMVGKTAWFVTFKGNFKSVDLSGDVARLGPQFSVMKPEGGTPEWRPGGWQLITSDASGLLYVLANPWGHNGSHKDGGMAVWVVDPAKQAIVKTIALQNHSLSLQVTNEEKQMLVASRADGKLDVYDISSGALIRSIAGVAMAPMTMTAVK